MKSVSVFRVRAVASAACLVVSGPLLAQQESTSPMLDKITITVTKREALQTDVPQSVQTISGDRLQSEGVQSVSDIVQLVPGASQTFKAAPGFEVLQVRGISSGAVGDALVGYYIDEIPFGLPNTQFIPPVNLFDLARVEVLRGPQGTLYGQSSMGGAIRMITKKPNASKFEGEVRLGYGSIDGGANAQRLDLMLNVPVKEDVFAIRITGGTSTEDGYVANTGKIKNDNLRLKALANLSEDLSADATLWSVKSRQGDYAYGRPDNNYTSITDPNEPRGVDTDVTISNITLNYATAIGDLVSSTSHMDHQFKYQFALPGLRDLALLPGSGQWLSTNLVKTRMLTQELRMTSKTGSPIGWIGGVFFQDSKVTNEVQEGWLNYKPFGLGASVYRDTNGNLSTKSLGVFGEISKELMGGKIVPTAGLRIYQDDRTGSDVTNGVSSNNSRTYHSVNPRFNVAFKPTKEQMFYVNAAKGFRSGANQSNFAAATARAAGMPAEPMMPEDSLWSYEGGMKWDVSQSLAFELAAYRLDWKDAQLSSLLVGAGGVTTVVVGGGTDIQGTGIDFGMNWATPVKGLTFQAAANINDTQFTKVPLGFPGKVGEQIPGSPRNSAALAMTYRTTLGGLRAYTSMSYNVRGSQSELMTGKSSDTIRAFNARVGLTGKSWDLSVYGQNLSDQRGVAAVLSSLAVNPIQPRKIGVDLALKF